MTGLGSLSVAALSPSLPPLQPFSPTLVQATQALALAVHALGALLPLPFPGQLLPIFQLKDPLLPGDFPCLPGVLSLEFMSQLTPPWMYYLEHDVHPPWASVSSSRKWE